jgi:hypothetical protein
MVAAVSLAFDHTEPERAAPRLHPLWRFQASQRPVSASRSGPPRPATPAPVEPLVTGSRRPAPIPLHPQNRPSYLGFTFARAFGSPSMGQAVKTHLYCTLADAVLTASVRCSWRPERSSAEWGRGLDRGSRLEGGETRDPIAAGSFSAERREPSFYRGLWGPSLPSALQGGIAYPGGLGPTGTAGPDQKSNGCSPLNRCDPGTDASEPFVLIRSLVSGQPLFDALSSLVGS